MAFKNLREDIAAEFGDLRNPSTIPDGFHIDPYIGAPRGKEPTRKSSEAGRAAKRAWYSKRSTATITERLQAGERPCMTRRPPTRWIEIAKQLGIDLYAPAAPVSP